MSEIEVSCKSNNKIAILERDNNSVDLELVEITTNFEKMIIGDLKKHPMKDGKQLLKDIFSTDRCDKKNEKEIKDDKNIVFNVNGTNIFKLTFESMKKRLVKNNKHLVKSKVLSGHICDKVTSDRKSVLKKYQMKNEKHLIKSKDSSGVEDKKIEYKENSLTVLKLTKEIIRKQRILNERYLMKSKVLNGEKIVAEDKHLTKNTVSIENLDENTEPKMEADSRSVFVGNVDYGTSTALLEKIFSRFGKIERVSIPLSKFTGKPKGFAYIEFDLPSSVEKAIKMNGFMLRGRPLQVKYKRTNLPGLSTSDRPSFEPVPSRSRKIHEDSLKRIPKVFDNYSFRNYTAAKTISKNPYYLNRKYSKINNTNSNPKVNLKNSPH